MSQAVCSYSIEPPAGSATSGNGVTSKRRVGRKELPRHDTPGVRYAEYTSMFKFLDPEWKQRVKGRDLYCSVSVAAQVTVPDMCSCPHAMQCNMCPVRIPAHTTREGSSLGRE
jgi:hypothetical protein